MDFVCCPHCGTQVMVMSDGGCPCCREKMFVSRGDEADIEAVVASPLLDAESGDSESGTPQQTCKESDLEDGENAERPQGHEVSSSAAVVLRLERKVKIGRGISNLHWAKIHDKEYPIVWVLGRQTQMPLQQVELCHKEKFAFWFLCVGIALLTGWLMEWEISEEAGILFFVFLVSVVIVCFHATLAIFSDYYYSHDKLLSIDSYWVALFIGWCAYRRFVPYSEASRSPRFADFSWRHLVIEFLMVAMAIAVAGTLATFFK